MNSLRAAIISHDKALVAELDAVIGDARASLFLKEINDTSNDAELESVLKVLMPSIVFLDLAEVDDAERVCGMVRRIAPATQLIGFARKVTQDRLLMAVRCALRDVMESPLSASTVRSSLERAHGQWRSDQNKSSKKQVITFLPGKIGSGGSTVALHTAFAISRLGKSKVTLMDLDFDCGMIDFMLKLPFEQTLGSVSEFGSAVDEEIWSKVVKKFANLDFMRAGCFEGRRMTARETENLLAFGRSSYDYVCVDLPGPLDEHSCAAIEQSDTVCLICNPEIQSVHLTRRRMEQFRKLGFPGKMRVVLNRHHARAALTRSNVEDVLRAEVFAVLDNDYGLLQRALIHGQPLDCKSHLGRQFVDLSWRLCGVKPRTGFGHPPAQTLWAQVAEAYRRTVAPLNAARRTAALLQTPAGRGRFSRFKEGLL